MDSHNVHNVGVEQSAWCGRRDKRCQRGRLGPRSHRSKHCGADVPGATRYDITDALLRFIFDFWPLMIYITSDDFAVLKNCFFLLPPYLFLNKIAGAKLK